jgi:hypothetical protein
MAAFVVMLSSVLSNGLGFRKKNCEQLAQADMASAQLSEEIAKPLPLGRLL